MNLNNSYRPNPLANNSYDSCMGGSRFGWWWNRPNMNVLWKQILCLIFWVGSLCPLSYGQDQVKAVKDLLQASTAHEDIVNYTTQLARYYTKSELDSALKYANIGLEAGRNAENDSLMCFSLNTLGAVLLINSQYQEALYRFEAELQKNPSPTVKPFIWNFLHLGYEGIGDRSKAQIFIDMALEGMRHYSIPLFKSTVLLNAGSFYKEEGEFRKAVYLYLEAQEIATLLNSQNLASTINQNLAGIYEVLGDYERALSLGEEELAKAREKNNFYGMLFSLYTIGDAQFEMGNIDESKKTALLAIKTSNESGESSSIGYAHFQLARVFAFMEEVDSAMFSINEGVRISQEQNELRVYTDCVTMKSRIYNQMGAYSKADSLARATLKIQLYHELRLDLYEVLADANEQLGRMDTAYKYRTLEKMVRDSLRQADPVYKLSAAILENEYQAKKDLLQEEYDSQIGKWKTQILLIGGCFSFIGLLLFFVYRSYLISLQNQKLTQINRALEQRNIALHQFTFISSHDLKEPVRVINTMAGMIQGQIKKERYSLALKQLDYIKSSAQILNIFITAIQEYAEEFNVNVAWSQVEVSELIKAVMERVGTQEGDTAPQIRWDIEESDDNSIFAPFSQVVRVLNHLLNNSFQAQGAEEVKCIISIRKSMNSWLFEVNDNGKGIHKDYHETIFRPFNGLENKMETQRPGLGLALCKLIVENNGGSIWVDSEVGKGTSVFFTIPFTRPISVVRSEEST